MADDNYFEITSPVDSSIVRRVEYTKDVKVVLQRSKKAQENWAKVPVTERIAILLAGVEKLVSQKIGLAEELTMLMGRPIRYTPNEIDGFAFRANYLLGIASEQLEDILVEKSEERTLKIVKEPVGIVLIIGAWNYPYLVIVNTLIPALASGNSVIIKHAPQTAPVGDNVKEAFTSAGLPEGILESIHLTNKDTEALVGNPKIDYVSLVGSIGAGQAVNRKASTSSESFVRVSLELGGCDAAYIRHDADIERAAEGVADGAFFNSGQSCCGIQRVFVHESRFDEFIEKFKKYMDNYKLGDPRAKETTLGPIVGPISLSDQQGARLIYKVTVPTLYEDDHKYMTPTLFIEPSPNSQIMTEEVFGPTVGICSVKDDEDAIGRINCTKYGLTTSIWTCNESYVEQNLHKFDSGTVYVNQCDWLRKSILFVMTYCRSGITMEWTQVVGIGIYLEQTNIRSSYETKVSCIV